MAKQIEKDNSSIWVNVFWNGLLSLSTILFPLLTFPYVTRVLGVEVNGAISFASSVVNYFALFATLGLSTYGVKACAQVKDNRKELSKVTQELLIISSISAIIVLAFLYTSLFIIPQFKNYRALMMVYSINIVLNVLGINWMYQGIERFKYITTRSMAFKVISIIMMFLFVKSPTDGVAYAFISVFAGAAGNVLNIIYSHNYITYKRFDHYNFRRHFKPLVVLFATTLAINVYSHLDSVMLGWMKGDYATGIYYVAIKVKTILLTLVNSFSMVMMTRVSYVNTKSKDKIFDILKKSYSCIIMISVPVVMFFITMSTESVIFLSGDDYVLSGLPMQILMPTIFFSAVSQIIGSQYSVSVGKEKNLMIAVIIGAIIDLILNAILIPKYSYVGAAIGTLIAELGQCTVQVVLAKDMVKKVFSFKKIIIAMFGSVLSTAMLFIVKNTVTFNSVFMQLLISAIVFFAVYFIFMIFSRYETCMDAVIYLKRKLSKGGINGN